jgi:hypothetical protein
MLGCKILYDILNVMASTYTGVPEQSDGSVN